MTKHRFLTRFLEFLVIGIIMGIAEDLLAIVFATNAKVDLRVIWIVVIVAVPFAVISELVVDHPKFWQKLFRFKNNK